MYSPPRYCHASHRVCDECGGLRVCTPCTVGLSSSGSQRRRGPVWLLPPAPWGHEGESCVMTDATLMEHHT